MCTSLIGISQSRLWSSLFLFFVALALVICRWFFRSVLIAVSQFEDSECGPILYSEACQNLPAFCLFFFFFLTFMPYYVYAGLYFCISSENHICLYFCVAVDWNGSLCIQPEASRIVTWFLFFSSCQDEGVISSLDMRHQSCSREKNKLKLFS